MEAILILRSNNPRMKLNELNSEPQNIEQEISNAEVWNRFALAISD
jgi:hypothetical protein